MKTFKPEELIENIDDIEIIKKLPENYLQKKAILGIDIYKYSKFPLVEQIYIPVIFEKLYAISAANVLTFEKFIFKSYIKKTSDFKKNFISTGDGGFQIFDNPLQALVFSIYFQANVKRFVSGGSGVPLLKKLHKIVDKIELRYAITFDDVYSYKNNFFGASIINNARILSKDTLNRLLVDDKTINWFTDSINSIENLIDLDRETFLQTMFFKDYDVADESLLFNEKGSFKSVDLLKIGQIEAKTTSLEIYNLHIQTLLTLKIEKHDYDRYLLTLGNLNTTGIK